MAPALSASRSGVRHPLVIGLPLIVSIVMTNLECIQSLALPRAPARR
jgi:hypothetical protein